MNADLGRFSEPAAWRDQDGASCAAYPAQVGRNDGASADCKCCHLRLHRGALGHPRRRGAVGPRRHLHPCDQLVIVIDHNEQLLQRTSRAFPTAEVVKNTAELRGIAGARNSGVHYSRSDVIAYLDDDAVAERDWLLELLAPYKDPTVIGTGSRIDPAWSARKPRWFPDEFGWVVGCSYRGSPRRLRRYATS